MMYAIPMLHFTPALTLEFSATAGLALPNGVSGCLGVLVQVSREALAIPEVFCSFEVGNTVRKPLANGVHIGSDIVLSPADARALALAPERAAEEAEEI
jgi:hypothetical protein